MNPEENIIEKIVKREQKTRGTRWGKAAFSVAVGRTPECISRWTKNPAIIPIPMLKHLLSENFITEAEYKDLYRIRRLRTANSQMHKTGRKPKILYG